MSDCVFCLIGAGDIAADTVFEDDEFVAFRDISPQAPQHVLVIPRRHFTNTAELVRSDPALAGRFLGAATGVAATLGAGESGYRMVLNTGEHGGQTVDHVHLHLLAGRHLTWPPG